LDDTIDLVVGNLDEFINPVDKFIHFSSQKQRTSQANRAYGKTIRRHEDRSSKSKMMSRRDGNRRRRMLSSDAELDPDEKAPHDMRSYDSDGENNDANESGENVEKVEDSDDSEYDDVYNEKATFADDDSDGNDDDDVRGAVKGDDEIGSNRGVNLNMAEMLSAKSADDTHSHTQPASKSTFLNRSTLETSSVSSSVRTSFRLKT
jgi:hypothetical protein